MVLMSIEQIQNFLTSPELPDIIAYVLLLVSFIYQYFIKAFVKKDNSKTMFSVDLKTNRLSNTEKELIAMKKKYEESEKRHNEEIEEMKKAIRLCSGNTPELVIKGIANKVAKLVPLENEETIIQIETPEQKEEPEEKIIKKEKNDVEL